MLLCVSMPKKEFLDNRLRLASLAMSDDDPPPPTLGAYTQPVSTTVRECQLLFDRGCVWAFSLHREEAVACFQRAAEADSACAMAHWGVAFANGPDYNWNESAGFFAAAAQHAGYPSFKVAADALERAAAALTDESPQRERDLVGALALLFEWPVTPTAAQRKVAYADAMQALAQRPNYAADADVQAPLHSRLSLPTLSSPLPLPHPYLCCPPRRACSCRLSGRRSPPTP